MGTCDSCGKFSFKLIEQTNMGIKRNMCPKCCEAANEVERMMTPGPARRHNERLHNQRECVSIPSDVGKLFK